MAASTQNQAKSALLFLYKEVLGAELPWLDGIEKAKASIRLPVVLTREEVAQVLARLGGVHRLIGSLLYGTGLRIMEAMRLRVKDVEFSRREIIVRDTSAGGRLRRPHRQRWKRYFAQSPVRRATSNSLVGCPLVVPSTATL